VVTNVSGGMTQGGGESVRRLRRRTDHRMLAGVAGGLADYTGIPVWLIRVGFFLLAFTGAGILLYGIGWVLIPAEGEAESIADRALRGGVDGPAWLGGLLLLIGALLIASRTHLVAPSLIWGAAFIAVGVYVFRRSERSGDRGDPPPAGWTATAPPAAGAPVAPPPPPAPDYPAAAGAVTTEVLPAPEVWTPPARVRPPRERSGLGWFVLGMALAAAGLLATLDQAGAISLRPGQYMGLILAILGGGMLVGAWMGRARWLAIPALLLLPFVIAASLIHVPFRGGFGDRVYRPATAADLRSEYRMVAGHLTIDLSRMDLGTSTVTIHASVVAGRLDVVVPSDPTVIVTGTVSAGSADLFGRNRDGTSVPLATVNTGTPESGTLRLDLGSTYGYVRVDHPGASFPSFSLGSLKPAGAPPAPPVPPFAPAAKEMTP
jgi:phage shock protein PspC (stress-responsive transcriptional regulator)